MVGRLWWAGDIARRRRGAGPLRACRVSDPGVEDLADPHSPRWWPPLQTRASRAPAEACLQGIGPWSAMQARAGRVGGRLRGSARARAAPRARLQDAGAGGGQLGRRQRRHARLQRLHGRQPLLPGRAAQARGHVLARQRRQRLLGLRARQRPALQRRVRARQRPPSLPGGRLGPEPASTGSSALPGAELGSPDTRALRRSSALRRQRCRAPPACSAVRRASARPQPGCRRMRLRRKRMRVGRGRPAGRRRRRRRSPAPRPGPPRAARASWRPAPAARAPAGCCSAARAPAARRARRRPPARRRARSGGAGAARRAARDEACGGAGRGPPRAPWRSG